jgi:Zn-dependent protease with chaperone function
VVKTIAASAGINPPNIYLLPYEKGVNVMSAGLNPDDSAIMVTKGALKYLSREELMGVIAHEITHIVKGDTRHNSLIAGWLYGFFILSALGTRLAKSVSDGPPAFFGFLLIGMGFLGNVLGQLIQSLLNRPRESLADAHSVALAGSPSYLAQAFKTIGGLDETGYLKNVKAHAADTRHLFIVDCSKTKLSSHPALPKRIWDLDPDWDGVWPDFTVNPVDLINEANEPINPPRLSIFNSPKPVK